MARVFIGFLEKPRSQESARGEESHIIFAELISLIGIR